MAASAPIETTYLAQYHPLLA